MPSNTLSHARRERSRALLRADLAWAYKMAALAFSRDDEVTAQRWLEQADQQRYALRQAV